MNIIIYRQTFLANITMINKKLHINLFLIVNSFNGKYYI